MVNSGLKFQALEPRIMFDGAAVFTGAEALDQIENQNTFDKESNLSKKPECKIDTDLELIIPRLEILEIEVCNILQNPGNIGNGFF